MLSLPIEVVPLILVKCDIKTITRFFSSNKFFNDVYQKLKSNDEFWKELCCRYFKDKEIERKTYFKKFKSLTRRNSLSNIYNATSIYGLNESFKNKDLLCYPRYNCKAGYTRSMNLEIYKLTHLEILRVNGQGILNFTDKISRLTNLKELSLTHY